ncbi:MULTISPECIES: MerR family transcriptional regulator [unclassified Corallococcus]|uniref:MerR family transcriptional regulator n=1 Tax=unclassified Corallococcus TaxID=2685029 RepID=UPI001A8EE466|nr:MULTISPECIES: MerR family transcriptional regulator [unclassified Corallococcus]MBN9688422.1 cobalamin-dependent protein [Corallococcus sp. NCSPR001]WAS87778.1 MerR family transcriptional regulator [Corallococcus sp. NCRR]
MAERTYRIHIAAELSGVRVELIRAWERRYGVLEPERTPSGYRVYTDRDVALLKRLKALTDEGVSISEAAKLVPQLRAELDAAPSPSAEGADARTGAQPESWRAAVMAAAEAYDQPRVVRVLDEVLAALPPLKAFEDVLVPVQREVGERWHAGTLTVAQEHLVTQVVRERLVSLLHGAPRGGRKHAVLACFPEEEHEIGLLGVALRLRHAGVRVTLLGQRVPAEGLGETVARAKPDVVGLSAVTNRGATVFEDVLERIMDALPKGLPLWVGGPAAQAHADICERLGVRLFSHEDDWTRMVG